MSTQPCKFCEGIKQVDLRSLTGDHNDIGVKVPCPHCRQTNLEAAFKKFDETNPRVWELFKQFASEAIRAGHQRIGVALIIERIRWQTMIETNGDKFKINNNHRAYYVRKWQAAFPVLENLFVTRKVKSV